MGKTDHRGNTENQYKRILLFVKMHAIYFLLCYIFLSSSGSIPCFFILIMIFWCGFNHMWILLAAVVLVYLLFLLLLFSILFVVPFCRLFLMSPLRGWNQQLGIWFLCFVPGCFWHTYQLYRPGRISFFCVPLQRLCLSVSSHWCCSFFLLCIRECLDVVK